MKQVKFLLCALSAVLLFASCNKEESSSKPANSYSFGNLTKKIESVESSYYPAIEAYCFKFKEVGGEGVVEITISKDALDSYTVINRAYYESGKHFVFKATDPDAPTDIKNTDLTAGDWREDEAKPDYVQASLSADGVLKIDFKAVTDVRPFIYLELHYNGPVKEIN